MTMPKFLTPKEVADIFRVSVPTVRRWARTGRLPGVWVGQLLRIDEADVKKLLDKK